MLLWLADSGGADVAITQPIRDIVHNRILLLQYLHVAIWIRNITTTERGESGSLRIIRVCMEVTDGRRR